MSRRRLLFLAVVGALAGILAGFFQGAPGYMDAEYYYMGGLRLADGHGFSEMILWNYLDDPAGLPHPSHAYWMPLTSILAAAGMKLTGSLQFTAARLPFLLLMALLPPVTAILSYQFSRRRDLATTAGLLAVFSGYYLPFLTTTDAFGPMMACGAGFLLALGQNGNDPVKLSHLPGLPARRSLSGLGKALMLGILAGLMHLARADGLIWLVVALAAMALPGWRTDEKRTGWGERVLCLLACLSGYLLVMGPWMLRNLSAFGKLLSPGGGHALWLTSYDELFIYPASLLTASRWWASGVGAILHGRIWALGLNLQTILAVQGEIFLAPLAVVGAWRLRKVLAVQAGALGWLLTVAAMTLVFPFAGARGGLFHSGAAVQPLIWAIAPVGLDELLAWGARRRNWNIRIALRVFQVGLVGLALLISGVVFYSRVIGAKPPQPAWAQGSLRYTRLEQALAGLGAAQDEVVMVNDAPGYYVASGRPAISIPYGDVATLLEVAKRYQARYLLLEINQLQGSDNLYDQPGDRPGLEYLETVENTRIYRLVAQ